MEIAKRDRAAEMTRALQKKLEERIAKIVKDNQQEVEQMNQEATLRNAEIEMAKSSNQKLEEDV